MKGFEHPLSGDVNWLLNRAWLGFGQRKTAALEATGVSLKEHFVMVALMTTPMPQLELSALVKIDKSVITATLDSLEAKVLLSSGIITAYTWATAYEFWRGRSEPLRAFEPLQDALFKAPATSQYVDAFAKLEAGDATAMPAFAALVGVHADDALAGFHLKRLLNGAKGVRMQLE